MVQEMRDGTLLRPASRAVRLLAWGLAVATVAFAIVNVVFEVTGRFEGGAVVRVRIGSFHRQLVRGRLEGAGSIRGCAVDYSTVLDLSTRSEHSDMGSGRHSWRLLTWQCRPGGRHDNGFRGVKNPDRPREHRLSPGVSPRSDWIRRIGDIAQQAIKPGCWSGHCRIVGRHDRSRDHPRRPSHVARCPGDHASRLKVKAGRSCAYFLSTMTQNKLLRIAGNLLFSVGAGL